MRLKGGAVATYLCGSSSSVGWRPARSAGLVRGADTGPVMPWKYS